MSGIINAVTRENYVEWEIPNFFPTSKDIDEYKIEIYLQNRKWTLNVDPRDLHGTAPYYFWVVVDVFVYSDSDFVVLLEVNDCKQVRQDEEKEVGYDGEYHKVWTWFYERGELQFLPRDKVLRGKVTIHNRNVPAYQSQFLHNTVHFRRNFQDLLLTGRNSDVSIEVQGRLFKAHKLILEACSPVFSAMFDHDMSERNKAIVKVDDCDSDIFQNFLECLYSGKLEKSSPDCLIGLYKISDKYCVSDLKDKCSKFMTEVLCEDTVLEICVVADIYNDYYLQTSVDTFLAGNIKNILRTEKWKKLMSENPSIAAKILTKIVEDC